MSRKIKFRQPIIDKDGNFIEWHYWGMVDGQWIEAALLQHGKQTREKSLQFTGLHDRNGKEIYEGDILNYKQHTEKGNWASKLDFDNDYAIKVEFKNGMFVCDYSDESLWHMIRPLRITEKTKWEVIGNIHENPEMITTA